MYHNWMKGLLAIATLLLCATISAGEQPSIAPAKVEKIHEVLRVTGAAKLGVQMMDQMIPAMKKTMPNVPDTFWTEFRAEVKPEEMENLIVPVYAKHFDDAELQGLIDFYSTPLGKKVIAEMPGVMQEAMAVGQKWGQELAQRVLARAKEKGYSLKS
jgi:hypothetical protein